MFLNRRSFLKSSSLLAWGLTVPTFLSRTASAAPAAGEKGAKDTLLVVVQLTGGNDGLNTVIPFKDPEYARLRPTLKIAPAQIRKINGEIGLHPSMTGLAELLNDDALCVVQGVGYPNPSQSHFRSMDIWQAGSRADEPVDGWIGRALQGLPGVGAFHLKGGDEEAPLALNGAPMRVPSIATLEDFQLRTIAASGVDKKEQKAVIESVAQPSSGQPSLLDFVSRTAAQTYESSNRLREIGKNYQPKVPYPNTPLANRLRLAAQLIDADVGARIFYVSIGGFDTHANQQNAHANLLGQVSAAMTAFYRDLAARGHGERLLLMTFSEFGRRARENGSRGTDHGSAAPMFLVGGRVKPGLLGEHPSLTELEAGNLKFHTDFRQVYAAVLDQWLGVSSKKILGETFAPLPIFKG